MTERGASPWRATPDQIRDRPERRGMGRHVPHHPHRRGRRRRSPRGSAARCGCARRRSRERAFDLDAAGRHHWWPMAPVLPGRGRLERAGPALDAAAPISTPTTATSRWRTPSRSWTWCRADLAARGGDPLRRDAPRRLPPEPVAALRRRRRRAASIARRSRPPLPPDAGSAACRARLAATTAASQVVRTFEDTPFYARSLLSSTLCGEAVTAGAREPVARPVQEPAGAADAAVPDAAAVRVRRARRSL